MAGQERPACRGVLTGEPGFLRPAPSAVRRTSERARTCDGGDAAREPPGTARQPRARRPPGSVCEVRAGQWLLIGKGEMHSERKVAAAVVAGHGVRLRHDGWNCACTSSPCSAAAWVVSCKERGEMSVATEEAPRAAAASEDRPVPQPSSRVVRPSSVGPEASSWARSTAPGQRRPPWSKLGSEAPVGRLVGCRSCSMLDAVYVSMLPPGSGTGTRVWIAWGVRHVRQHSAAVGGRRHSTMSYQIINHRRECCTAVCVKSVYVHAFADDIQL